jgi:hypothetical protein
MVEKNNFPKKQLPQMKKKKKVKECGKRFLKKKDQ